MKINPDKFFRVYYTKITESIAFYPAIISLGFLVFSWVMISFDASEWGKDFKSSLSWLSLKDASTARAIVTTVAGAVISLTVFSFSMVMIVLNQAASQMSNRVLSSMIENRFQQIVLGFYIGTTMYAFFLLSTIRDVSSGIYVPALSVYFLILLIIIDIFLFIYFLDYVTQTVKYETVIDRVSKETMRTMDNLFEEKQTDKIGWIELPHIEIKTQISSYFQKFNEKKLLEIAKKENLYISFLYKPTSYLLKGTTCAHVYSSTQVNEEIIEQIQNAIDLYDGQPIDKIADYGFRQLTEIALKALSPGINDPSTAVIALNSITGLLAYRLDHSLPEIKIDDQSIARIHVPSPSFEEMFKLYIYPIWQYGKEDMYIQKALINSIEMLKNADSHNAHSRLFDILMIKVKEEYDLNITLK